MSGNHERRQPFVICHIDAQGDAIKFRFLPRDWEGNRSIEENVEIVSIVCSFVEVIAINHQVFAKRLLNAKVELAPSTWPQWLIACIAQNPIGETASSGRTRKNQVLVVRSLEVARK